MLFNGLKQAGKYRESILNGLWNHQLLNMKFEQKFNQWLCKQSSYCSICYFFIDYKSNKNNSNKISSIRYLLMSEVDNNTSDNSNELLQCLICRICVHRDCYERLCLALNVQINDEYDPWLCQRCILKKQVNIEFVFVFCFCSSSYFKTTYLIVKENFLFEKKRKKKKKRSRSR